MWQKILCMQLVFPEFERTRSTHTRHVSECVCVCIQRKTCICKKNQKIETGNWVSVPNALPQAATAAERGKSGKVCLPVLALTLMLAKTSCSPICSFIPFSQHLTLEQADKPIDQPTGGCPEPASKSDYSTCIHFCVCVYICVCVSMCAAV